MYKTNPDFYNGIFAVPSVLTDKYIKLTSEPMLKTALLAFRHAYTLFDAEFIAREAGLTVDEAQDALIYWCSEGILINCDKPQGTDENNKTGGETGIRGEAQESNSEQAPPKSENKRLPSLRPGKISYQQICARIAESQEVQLLFSLAQEKLGRTIGTADQSVLLNLHDFYGLPVEVILALCHYASTHGKSNNINYIFNVGANWSDREIDTIEAADREFRRLEEISVFWVDFCKETGISVPFPTIPQQRYLEVWINDWKFSNAMIVRAFEEMSKNTKALSFPYMNKILAGWHSAGVKTPEDVEEYQRKHRLEKEEKAKKRNEKKSGKSKGAYGVQVKSDSEQTPASYDLEKATELMNLTVPKYKKKEKR